MTWGNLWFYPRSRDSFSDKNVISLTLCLPLSLLRLYKGGEWLSPQIRQPVDCNTRCYLWTLPCGTKQNTAEGNRAKNNKKRRRGKAAVVWVYLREAGGFLFLFVVIVIVVFVFFFFLDCWRLRWLEGCVRLWLSSWVFSESTVCWGRVQHQLVSIRLCRT